MRIDLADLAATGRLAEDVAVCLGRGDILALSGGLGAGKTAFARALIRAFLDDAAAEVPSPTFTIVQTYEGRLPVAHFDLYRLAGEEELDETGFDDAREEGILLVEWPERAGSRLPDDRLDLAFEVAGDGRIVTVSGSERLVGRFRRSRAIRHFLDRAGRTDAARRFLQGDASLRAYERIATGPRREVLMDWPPAKEAASRDSLAAWRARDVRPFIAIADALRAAGLSAPVIEAADMGAGFLLMEDLGSEPVVDGDGPIVERYEAAVAVLAALHAEPRPAELPLPDGTGHVVPAYRAEALAAEVALFPDHYVEHATGRALEDDARRDFDRLWAGLIRRLDGVETSWALLDYHSPNLLWLPERRGIARVGLLDFQDMMMGPTAYDVASLAQDARVTVPAALEDRLVAHYVALRKAARPDFDETAFREAYLILAAQRATRILGVFVRLAGSGKTGYLRHIPRLREYLGRLLAQPVLSGLAVWYERHRLP